MLDWWRTDLGTHTNVGIDTWTGQFAGLVWQAASGGVEATLTATGPNGRLALVADGLDDYYVLTGWNPPAPAATPILIWGFFANLTLTNGRFIFAGNGSAVLSCVQVTGNFNRLSNGANGGNVASQNGSYKRLEACFSNTTSDRLKFGANATTVPGTNLGNADATGFALFGRTTGVGVANAGCLEIGIWLGGELTGPEYTALDAYGANLYGSTPFT